MIGKLASSPIEGRMKHIPGAIDSMTIYFHMKLIISHLQIEWIYTYEARVKYDFVYTFSTSCVAAATASPGVVGTPTDAHTATVICAIRPKNLLEVNHVCVASCW